MHKKSIKDTRDVYAFQFDKRDASLFDKEDAFHQFYKETTALVIISPFCMSAGHVPYTRIRLLSHDYPISAQEEDIHYYKFIENKEQHYNGYYAHQDSLMSQSKAIKAIEYE